MKKFIICAAILSLLLPAVSFAAAEFSLGGFIKLDAFWDSTQNSKNINGLVARNNDGAYHHGNMRFTAQGSRFNFTIKGPKVFGAQTTGFIEMDFDSSTNMSGSASQVYIPRLRHAMFRLNWPETELLFGQYWSMFCSYYAETAEDGPFQAAVTPTARLAQIRLTQKFLSDWEVAGLIGQGQNAWTTRDNPYDASTFNGADAETPQVQGMIKYSHDWWGKAAYYGKPIPFTAQITAGWQRNIAHNPGNVTGGSITWPNAGVPAPMPNQYINPWLVMGSLFIPVIPTHSANLAGTAHIFTQWWMGAGVEAFGFTGSNNAVLHLNSTNTAWDISPQKRFGGGVEGQYYFTNEWYVNAAYGISKVYGLRQGFNINGDFLTTSTGANAADAQFKAHQQVNGTLWYRPIQALKFGLQYSFAQTNWLTDVAQPTATTNATSVGTEHRVEFVGFFYF